MRTKPAVPLSQWTTPQSNRKHCQRRRQERERRKVTQQSLRAHWEAYQQRRAEAAKEEEPALVQ